MLIHKYFFSNRIGDIWNSLPMIDFVAGNGVRQGCVVAPHTCGLATNYTNHRHFWVQ